MSAPAKILCKLVKIALGNEFDYSLPSSIDWKCVINLSIEQGVAAFAVDGLQKVYDERPDGMLNHIQHDALDKLDSPELEDDEYDWFGYALSDEADYERCQDTIAKLASLYSEFNCNMLLPKGYGLSLSYPIPAHSPCGDIDIYLFEKEDVLNEAVGKRYGEKVDGENAPTQYFS